jgi:hypothetical protein
VRNMEDTDRICKEHPAKTKRVSFVGSLAHADDGAYAFRRVVASELQARGDIDCFGKGIYEIPAKPPAIAPYCFSVAMENAARDHYFSEKLVDCILLETIPIYYGCPGIGDLLDPRGLLRFQTLPELTQILNRLTPSLYDEMRPFAVANKQALLTNHWESHLGLFSRIALRLQSDLTFSEGIPHRQTARLWRFVDRLLRANGAKN